MNKTLARTLWERWQPRLLAPPVFFVGVMLGFTACCLVGRQAPKVAPIEPFQRFGYFTNPEGLYFPTALQIRVLARRQLPRDKIAVVVGGSSVMQGIGQTSTGLWTLRLQRALGDEFRVLNLAMPGGAPDEYGQLAVEMLLCEHRNLIYLCDSGLGGYAHAPDGNRDIYRYFYHDARTRGLLVPFPERDAALAALAPQRQAKPEFTELAIQTQANHWLSFNDLWQVVGYEHVFTVWNKYAWQHPWRARKQQPDPTPPKYGHLYHVRNLNQEIKVVRDHAQPLRANEWDRYEAVVRHTVPAPLRPLTLAVVNRFSPYYLKKIEAETPGFTAQFEHKIEAAAAHLRACGLNAVTGCAAMTEDDFLDRHHLLDSGGAKLADELAPVIRAQAQRLGYLPGDVP